MNILKLLDKYSAPQTEQPKPETNSRRDAFRQFGSIVKDVAMVSIPFGAALVTPHRSYAQMSGSSVVDVLNFALTLEYLEAEFYQMGLDAGGLLSGDVRSIIAQIGKHEDQHVEFLRVAINSLGGTPIDKPEFDFTAGGTFSDVFSNMQTYLALAQAFEDTGVRAYKGQAANLIMADDILQAALQIHSVEARHASEVRRLRGSKGWIVEDENTSAPAAAAVYAGEDNLIQLGVDASSVTPVNRVAVTESYDEPLSRDEVLAIASLFLA
ncbi:MAG: ferritin-like domain-containing protein [Bacteroidota bacterium]